MKRIFKILFIIGRIIIFAGSALGYLWLVFRVEDVRDAFNYFFLGFIALILIIAATEVFHELSESR